MKLCSKTGELQVKLYIFLYFVISVILVSASLLLLTFFSNLTECC